MVVLISGMHYVIITGPVYYLSFSFSTLNHRRVVVAPRGSTPTQLFAGRPTTMQRPGQMIVRKSCQPLHGNRSGKFL